jgi:methylmalonyl-CoA/ethylmalonyl-CoA epimerase
MAASFDGLGRLAQVSMTVHDLGRAEAFYRDVLGMKHLFSVPPKMAFFDCAGTRLYLAIPEKPEFDHPGSVLYFAVADIQAAHAALVGRGVVFEEAPHLIAKLPHADLWMAAFRDSEGNFLALQSEVPRT